MEKNCLYVVRKQFKTDRAPGLVCEYTKWNKTVERTTNNIIFPGTVLRLVGIEQTFVCCNFYFYLKSSDESIIMIDEINDPDNFMTKFVINYNNIWNNINV